VNVQSIECPFSAEQKKNV